MPPKLFIPLLFGAFLICRLSAQSNPPSSPSPLANSPATVTAAFWNIQWFPGRRPNASRAEENRQIRAVRRGIEKLTADGIGPGGGRGCAPSALGFPPV